MTICVGIDENGLGPRLGPLVVTAVAARVEGDGHKRLVARPRGGLRSRLGDSKRLVAYGDSGLGEAWARAIVARTRAGAARPGEPQAAEDPAARAISDPEALVHALSLDSPDDLRAPCPREHLQQCWASSGEAFVADEKLVTTVGRDLDRLEAQGVAVLYARLVVTCTRRLNEGVERGLTRFHLDLHAMERLALDARERVGADVLATCGKVGGFDRYPAAFGPMNGRLYAVAQEGRARSEYSVPGLGTIAFVRDAEDKHLLVSMASLVGKWVRDALMARIVRYHRSDDPALPDASGYHDPVTTRFIKATRLTRRSRALPDDCFERRAWGDSISGTRASRSASGPSRPSSA